MKLEDKDKKYLGRSESEPIVVTRTEGSFIYDSRGKKYIDFGMGWNVGNFGWNSKHVARSLKKFNGPTYVAPSHLYRGWADLAELLANIAPGKLVKSFRAATGTESVEMALQAAMVHTGRNKFISIEGSYHGNSIAAKSIGSSSNRKTFRNLLPDCHKIDPPLNENTALAVEKLISKKDVAAYISEPIICSLGALKPEDIFYEIVRKACKKYGTLFIMDEVATGFGHTGKIFASEHFNLQPDILCFAKAVTGGHAPMGGTLMTEEVAKSFSKVGFYSTYGWHPLSVEAALANIRFLVKNQRKIFSTVEKLSMYFRARLESMPFRSAFKINGLGLSIGIKFEREGYAGEIVKKTLKKRLIITDASGGSIVMFPALDMDLKTAKEGLDILESCL